MRRYRVPRASVEQQDGPDGRGQGAAHDGPQADGEGSGEADGQEARQQADPRSYCYVGWVVKTSVDAGKAQRGGCQK
jgi:hypothetical protein